MKRLIRLIIVIIIIFLSVYIHASTNGNSRDIIDSMKVYNADVGLKLNNKFYYQDTYYTKKPLPIHIQSTYINRLLEEEYYKYSIKYDTLINPIIINYKDIDGNILTTIEYEYDEDQAVYPYPDTEIFNFINISAQTRLRLKKITDYENDTIYYQVPYYSNKYLTELKTLNTDGELIKTISYKYDDKNRLKIIEYKDSQDNLIEHQKFLYDVIKPKRLRFILKSSDYPYLSEYISIMAFSNGDIWKEYYFLVHSKIHITDFSYFDFDLDPYKRVEYWYGER